MIVRNIVFGFILAFGAMAAIVPSAQAARFAHFGPRGATFGHVGGWRGAGWRVGYWHRGYGVAAATGVAVRAAAAATSYPYKYPYDGYRTYGYPYYAR